MNQSLLSSDLQKNAEIRKGWLDAVEAIKQQEAGGYKNACLRVGISRKLFYKYKKRYAELGLDGLMDRPPIRKTFPEISEERLEFNEDVVRLVLELPQFGSTSLKESLGVSHVTIRKILKQAGLATKADISRALEKNGKKTHRRLRKTSLFFSAS